MSKLTNRDNLEKLAKALDARAKANIKASVAEEAARAQGAESILQEQIEVTQDMFGGKSIRYITQAQYNQLTDEEKNDPTIAYFIIDAEDLSHTHANKALLDSFGARTLTIGNKGKTFDGSANVSWTLSEIGAAASGHNHDDRYYTESEMNTKVTNLQAEIDADVKVETDRAKAAEAALQAAIDGKAGSGHTHDDRYFTETEVTNKLNGLKADLQAEIDADVLVETNRAKGVENSLQAAIDGKSPLGHAHDDRYLTEEEVEDLADDLRLEIENAVNVEEDRALAAEAGLQAAIDGKANASHGLHVPSKETANNARFLRNDNTWQTITPANIGAAATVHSHDDLYYTEAEIDAKVTTLNNAINGKAPSSHNHDNIYFTETEINAIVSDLQEEIDADVLVETNRAKNAEAALQSAINGKANSSHNHDDRYYTETEINNTLANFESAINEAFGELEDAYEAADIALQTAIDGKSPLGHSHDDRYFTETEVTNRLAEKSDVGHDHADLYYDKDEMDTRFTNMGNAFNGMVNSLANKADKVHTHDDRYYTETEIDGKVEDIVDSIDTEVARAKAAETTLQANIDKKANTGHTHDDRYYTETEINTKVTTLQGEIADAVEAEANRAKDVESTLQANIDKKANASHSHNDVYYTESEIDEMLTGYSGTGHTHDGRYYTEAEIDSKVSTLNTAINGKANTSHGNHVPATQTAANNVFLRNDNTWATVTPDNIGAAKASHGTHVTWANAVPKANGTAAIGSVGRVAREDHVHPLQESAAKLTTARTITIGNQGIDFDGSENIAFTLGEIGAADSGHNHDNRYYTESEINTKVADLQAEIDADVEAEADRAKAAENTLQANIDKKANASHGNHVPATETANNAKFLRNDNTWATVTPANIGAAATSHSHDDKYYTETEIDSKVTTLNNAINGKADKSHGNHVPEVQTASNKVFLRNDNTWATITPANIGAAASSHGTHVTYATATPLANGTAAIGTSGKVAREDHVHPLQETVSGNAGSADKLSTPRNITIGNQTNAFDGSENITFTLSEMGASAEGHNHDGRYYTESEINTKVTNLQSEIDADVLVETNRAKAAETALQANIDKKADASHGNHVPTTQTASNKVFLRNDNTWATITPANIGASATGHTHDDRYYTETEIDAKVTTINTAISTAKSDAQKYADNKIASLIDSAPDALNTLNELATAITDHQDVYDAYVAEVDAKLAGKSDTGHTHNYAGSSSAGGAATSANKVNQSLKVQLNGGTTEGTNQFTFNGSAAKTINITPSGIGAAASSHGTHVTYGTATPKANGTAAVGTSGDVSRADHVHPLQTTVSGNAGSANKWTNPITLTIGNKGKSVDGSANVSWTLAEIGASESGHTHNYAGSSSAGGAANSVANSIKIQLNGGTTEGTNQFTFNGSTAKSINITPSSIGAAASSHGTHVSLATAVPLVASGTGAVGTSSKQAREDHVHPPQTSVTGNAGTATKLATARTITVNGVVSGSTSFDGSANVTITTVANDITSITKKLTVGTDWMDTGITGSNLATGTYAVQMYANCQGTGGIWTEYFSGIMSWYASGTNSSEADEIALHKAGHAPNNQHIYLRTKRNTNGNLMLQIAAKTAITAEIQFDFKFKKLI